MSSPEEVAEKAFGGKWEVTSLANEFEKGRKQGALEELKELNIIIESVDYQIIKKHIKKRIKELEEGVSK